MLCRRCKAFNQSASFTLPFGDTANRLLRESTWKLHWRNSVYCSSVGQGLKESVIGASSLTTLSKRYGRLGTTERATNAARTSGTLPCSSSAVLASPAIDAAIKGRTPKRRSPRDPERASHAGRLQADFMPSTSAEPRMLPPKHINNAQMPGRKADYHLHDHKGALALRKWWSLDRQLLRPHNMLHPNRRSQLGKVESQVGLAL